MNKIVTTIILLLLSAPAIAANHYVRAGASGSADGSDWTNACTDFTGSCAVASLTRGDTYYVASGAYSGRTFNKAASGNSLITIKKATVADHGTATGWNDSYATGQAAWTGTVNFSTNYWTFDGVTGGGPGSWATGYGFKVTTNGNSPVFNVESGASNITVRHVEAVGSGVESGAGMTTQDGVDLYDAGANITFSYIWTRNIGRCPVRAPSPVGPSIFEYIYVTIFYAGYDPNHHGEIMSGRMDGNNGTTTWRYSLITYWTSTGGIMWDHHGQTSSHLYIYGNVFLHTEGADAPNGVIGGWTGGGGEIFNNAHIYNNTFINLTSAPFFGYFAAGHYGTNNEVYNNIFYNTTSPNYNNTYVGGVMYTHNYNHYINSGGSHSEANGTTAASGDPFVDYIHYNFNLSRGTTAGKSLFSPFNTDSNGIIRGGDGVWDFGAYEFTGKIPLFPTNIIIN